MPGEDDLDLVGLPKIPTDTRNEGLYTYDETGKVSSSGGGHSP